MIRYLALGGCEAHRTHEKGIQLEGANIVGALDFVGCQNVRMLVLWQCRMSEGVNGLNASLGGVYFDGSSVDGLNLQRAVIKGGVLLRNGFSAMGEVRLSGAEIDGQLSCTNGSFSNEEGFALNAHSAVIKGGVFLSEGFSATGEVCLSGAEIGGVLSCINGSFRNKEGDALNAQGAEIKGGLFWRDVSVGAGGINLVRVSTSFLNDHLPSWPETGLEMDGFRYEAILAYELDVDARLEWLEKNNSSGADFEPQPYQQLAEVYGEMGHRRDRAAVLMEMETRLRAWQLKKMQEQRREAVDTYVRNPGWPTVKGFIWSFWDDLKIFGHTMFSVFGRAFVGYGHRPALSILWAIGIIGLTAFGVDRTYRAGDFAPSAPQVLVSYGWQKYARDSSVENPAEIWTGDSERGQDYTTFQPVYYAADLFIPLVNFEQDAAWAPSTTRSWRGIGLHYVEPWIKLFGWIITAMGAAAITGFIRND